MIAWKQLAVWLLALWACPAICAGDLPRRQSESAIPLCEPGELESISMSMVDEKIALSLAVETHVQVELLEYALAEIDEPALHQLAEKRLRLYNEVLAALDDLTDGRSAGILGKKGVRPAPQAAATAHVGAGDDATAARTPAKSPATRIVRVSKGGGVGSVLQNATNSAILKVRLQIAGEYADLLRASLDEVDDEDFDRSYSAVDVFNQMQVVALFRVFERQASDDFGAILRRATTAAEKQLEEARALAVKFDSQHDAASETMSLPGPRR